MNGEYWGIYLALEAVEDSFMLRNYGVTNGALYKPDTMGISRDEGDWGGWGDDDDEGWGASDGDRQEDGDEGWGDSWGDRQEDGDEGWGDSWGDRQEDGDEGWGGSGSGRRGASEEPEPDPMPPEGELSDSMQAIVDTMENGSESSDSASDEPADASEEGADEASGEASGESEWSWGDDNDDWGGGGFGGMFGGSGANLNYTGDDLSNYSTIWLSEVTTTGDADHRRVVEALKNISEGENLEESMDIDNLLRLMAVHNFSVNSDSLSGSMAHNYYLYESNGQLNILPWDYNLAFGGMGFGGSSADEVANEPIDDSWQSTNFFDPLLENEEYLEKYHEYYRQLVEEYIFGGGFYEFYTRTRSQIDDLVATDPNALYDYDEYDAAAETLYALVVYRGESILGQLNGTIPSTSAGQRQDSSNLIKAEGVDISLMGSMSMGGSFGGGGGWGEGGDPFRRNRDSSGESSDNDASGEQSEDASGEQTESASGEAEDTASSEPAGSTAGEQTELETASAEPAETAETETASDEIPATGADESAEEENAETETAEDEQTEAASGEPAETDEDENDSDETENNRSASGEWSSASGEMRRQENTKSAWLLAACGAVLIIGLVVAVIIKKKG